MKLLDYYYDIQMSYMLSNMTFVEHMPTRKKDSKKENRVGWENKSMVAF